MSPEDYKRQAAAAALEFVEPGMRLGLGTGSTAKYFVELLADRVRAGLDVLGVATSEATRADAERLGVPLTTLDETPELDLTIDGADEIAPDLALIKGGGGALLHEKIVAAASSRMIVIADESKWVALLGRFPLPVEVVSFGLAATRRAIGNAAAAVGAPGPITLRRTGDGHAFVTEGGHLILDAALTLRRALQGRTEFMMAHKLARGVRAADVGFSLAMSIGLASAQEPSPSAMALAKELIVLKGSTQLWDAVVPGVIEQAKGVYLQTNPALGKELSDVAAQLRSEYAPRASQLSDQVAQLYAKTFTEQELKDALAFYKTPLGKKIVNEEPKVLDDGFRRIQQWTNKFSEEVMNRMRAEMKKKGYDL